MMNVNHINVIIKVLMPIISNHTFFIYSKGWQKVVEKQ